MACTNTKPALDFLMSILMTFDCKCFTLTGDVSEVVLRGEVAVAAAAAAGAAGLSAAAAGLPCSEDS